MADLLDIAPSTSVEVVKIDGKRIIVRGLRCDAVASIAARFPKIIGLLLGGSGAVDYGPRFIEQAGDAVGPIIAAGDGHLGYEKYEQHAAKALLLEDQLRLVKAIIGVTFPKGFGFFVELLAGLTSADEEAKVVKVRLRQSPSSSPPLSAEASHLNMQ